MRERLERVPGGSSLFTTPLGMRMDEGLGGTPADLYVRIFGSDLEQLSQLGERARAIMSQVKGVTDLRVEKLTGMPQLRISINRPAVARVGLTPGDVISAVRVGLAGQDMSEVWIGQRRFDLVLRLQDESRNDANAIRRMLIDGHDGTRIPLGQLAEIEETFGPGAIRREAGTRRIALEAGVDGRDLGSTASDIRSRFTKQLQLPPGYFFDVGGKVEGQERAARSLAVAIGVALFAVFLLLYLALDSTAEAAMIWPRFPWRLSEALLLFYLRVKPGTFPRL